MERNREKAGRPRKRFSERPGRKHVLVKYGPLFDSSASLPFSTQYLNSKVFPVPFTPLGTLFVRIIVSVRGNFHLGTLEGLERI
jgi:hypothetical protein